MKIISNLSGQHLAARISERLKIKPVRVSFSKFPDGEKRVRVLDDLKNQDLLAVLGMVPPVDENIIESLLLLDALEQAKVRSVKLIIPWLGYALQNKVFRPGEPLSARMIARLFDNHFIKKIILLDTHSTSILDFFLRPVENKSATDIFIKDIRSRFKNKNIAIASTDKGGIEMSKYVAHALSVKHLATSKERDRETGKVRINNIEGDFNDEIIILVDDGIITGNTLAKVVQELKRRGTEEIHFYATHAVLSDGSIERIDNLHLQSITFTNSIYHKIYPRKIRILDCSGLFI